MSYQLVNARVWDGSQWVAAVDPSPPPTPSWGGPTTLVSQATVTASASSTPHQYGAWFEVIASTSAEADVLYVSVTGIGAGTTNTSTLMDVGLGPSGSETVVAAGIAVGGAGVIRFPLPVAIAAGSRIAIRTQALIPSDTAVVTVQPMLFGIDAPASVDVLGTNNTTSEGTSCAANGWRQVVSSTSRTYKMIVAVGSLSSNATPSAAGDLLVGTGSAGSEVTVAKTFGRTTISETCNHPDVASEWSQVAGPVPAGSRISVYPTGFPYWATIIGVPYP